MTESVNYIYDISTNVTQIYSTAVQLVNNMSISMTMSISITGGIKYTIDTVIWGYNTSTICQFQ